MAEYAVFTAVINKVVELGANLIVETGSRLYRLKEDIEWIEGKMRHFNSCLKDAESKQDGRHEVTNLINDMRDLALDIENLLDTYLPEIASHKGKGPFGLVKHAACILCYGSTKNTFALEIEKIRRRAQVIEDTRQRCQVNADTVGGNADSEVWNRRKEFLVATESMVVGREDKFQELKEKLRSSNSECKIMCVVGEAGVGKTTVAKKIYNDIRHEFTSSALVYVSNEPRINELLHEIAKQVGLEEEKMKQNLKVNLRALLNEKRCLIFLDDIWKFRTWDALENVIPMDSRNGSRIIITSRYTDVGRYIGSESSLIEVKLLDQEKSWELFSERMKSSSENTNERFPPIELEDIAKKIVERCGGLPLAIVVAVGMLRQRRRNKHAWNEVLVILSTSAENNCSDILSLSYKDLPPELRPFFLYFGLFPEDKEIFSDVLVRAWVSEKLIQVDGNRDPNDIVAVKLEMLCDRNLIQVSIRGWDGRVISYRIHDLLRALCIEMANENNFFGTHHNIHSNSFSMLRRLTIDDTSQFSFSKTPKLRTLFCFCNSGEGWSLIPNEIGDLSRLTYLKLSGRFERMPSTIRNLKKLVTFDIKDAKFCCALPRTILRMKYLKHLLIHYDMMFESNKCTNLNVRNEVYLPNIETLYWVSGTILKASSLQKLSNLRELRLYEEINDQHINVISGTTPILKKLQVLHLSFNQNFKRLNLSCYDHLAQLFLSTKYFFPFKLDTIEFPPNLICLSLWYMKFTEDPMKVLKELQKLETLDLSFCSYSPSITLDFLGENSFPELRELVIQGIIPKLIVDQTGMPKLYKFVCDDEEDLNVPERLREIMVDPFIQKG